MSQTVDTFWQAVWEADVYLVVRLTSKEEEDCFAYLPESSDHCLQLGDVWIQQSVCCSCLTWHQIQLQSFFVSVSNMERIFTGNRSLFDKSFKGDSYDG